MHAAGSLDESDESRRFARLITRLAAILTGALAIGFAAAVAPTLALGCADDTEPFFESRLPIGYELPDGGTYIESVRLGTTVSYVFQFTDSPKALTARTIQTLRAGHWGVSRDERGALVSRGPGIRIETLISANDRGAQLVAEVIRGSAPAVVEAPILHAPPPAYPKGFPFVPGGRLHGSSTDPPSVEIDYDDVSRKEFGDKLRGIAERAFWMCTQGERRFLCSAGGRTVDVILWRKGRLLRAEIAEVGG